MVHLGPDGLAVLKGIQIQLTDVVPRLAYRRAS